MATLDDLDAARGPFASVVIDVSSRVEDAAHRLEVQWRNAVRQLTESGFPDDDVAALTDLVGTLRHDEGEALAVVRAAGGPQLVERLGHPVERDLVTVDTLPRYGPILENRQRIVPHVVVEVDRAGAEIISFDAGGDVGAETVEGETLHIHRGHPGGWSQRRFQQRAENQWESNASDAAAEVAAVASSIEAELIVVSGDVRAVGFLTEHLPEHVRPIVHVIEEGSADGIADATVRLVDDAVARTTRTIVERWRERVDAGTACGGADDVLEALEAGRVDCLLVHDDPDDVRHAEVARGDDVIRGRFVDVVIRAARTSGAQVRMTPTISGIDDGVGALLRW